MCFFQLGEFAKKHRVAVHLDGARILNAAFAQRVAPSRLTACADSVMMCISKGVGAPCGSLVAGSHTFIQK